MPNPTAKPRFSARALGMTRPLVLGLALSALAMPPALMAHDGKPHGQKNDPYEELANDGLQIKRGKNTGKGQGITAGYDLKNTHDAGVSKITLGNIQNLEHQWTYITQLDSEGGDAEFAGVEVMPLLKGNTLYFPDTFGNLHAVDRRTGVQVWKKSFLNDYSDFGERIVHVSRNTPVARGNVIFIATSATILNVIPGVVCETSNFVPDCLPGQTGTFLLAINRHNGELIWATQIDDTFVSQATGSPVLFQNYVIVTLSSNEELMDGLLDPDTGNDPVDPRYKCCRFRGKTVAVNLDGSIAWKFYHVPSFTGPNNDSSPAFQKTLTQFRDAMKEYLGDLDPSDPYFIADGEDLPRREAFFGAGSWGKGNPAVDVTRGFVLVSPGSNYTVPDLVRQCQRTRQGNINPVTGNKNYNDGPLDPEAYLRPGFNCDNINRKLDNYLNSIVALDVTNGEVVWAVRDDVYDSWNDTCQPHDISVPTHFSNLKPVSDPFQSTDCDALVKPDDYGFAQLPMILRKVPIKGQLMDLVAVGQKSGDLYRFDLATGGKVFFSRKKIGHGGILGGLHYPHATDGKIIYMASGTSHSVWRDVRNPYFSTRDDSGLVRGDGLVINERESDPRLPARASGPIDIRTLIKPSPDTFVDADVLIKFDGDCSAYDPVSISGKLCNGIDPFTNNNNADAFRINEFGDRPYRRVVTVLRDWRDKAPGESIDEVSNPNSISNPISGNVEGNAGNKIMTVRDLADCSNPSDLSTCAIKTVASFWFALDASSGEIVWSRPHPAGGYINSAFSISGDLLFSGASGEEDVYIDPIFDDCDTACDPNASEVPRGGGLRYAINKHTGEIVARIHTLLENRGIEVDDYPLANPLVSHDQLIWGTGWGHYNAVDPTQAGNKLHSFKLSK